MDGTLRSRSGDHIVVKACRLGFCESPAFRIKVGGDVQVRPSGTKVNQSTTLEAWDRIELTALQVLKMLERQQDFTLSDHLEWFTHPIKSIRYWSILAVTHSTELKQQPIDPETRSKIIASLRERIYLDMTPAVRIAVAELLCRLGCDGEGLPVLVEFLKALQRSVRHLAAVALGDLDKLAKPAIPAITEYVVQNWYDQDVASVLNRTLHDLHDRDEE